jgi:hypothetical protein
MSGGVLAVAAGVASAGVFVVAGITGGACVIVGTITAGGCGRLGAGCATACRQVSRAGPGITTGAGAGLAALTAGMGGGAAGVWTDAEGIGEYSQLPCVVLGVVAGEDGTAKGGAWVAGATLSILLAAIKPVGPGTGGGGVFGSGCRGRSATLCVFWVTVGTTGVRTGARRGSSTILGG